MLVLSRKRGEEILFTATAESLRALADRIGDGKVVIASIMYVEYRPPKVRLGIEAPDEIGILRAELPPAQAARRICGHERVENG